jgi:hypothetical protein
MTWLLGLFALGTAAAAAFVVRRTRRPARSAGRATLQARIPLVQIRASVHRAAGR